MEDIKDEDMNKKLTEWDPLKMVEGTKSFSIMMVAVRRSGKTLLLHDIMTHIVKKKHYKDAYLFSGSAQAQSAYQFIPTDHQYSAINDAVIGDILTKQKRAKEEAERKGIDTYPHVLIVADDVVGTKEARNSPNFTQLFTLGRHFNVDIIALSQTLKGFTPAVRGNSDVVIVWNPANYDDKEDIINSYMGRGARSKTQGRHDGLEIIETITSVPYRAMVIDVWDLAHSKNKEEYVHWYLAKPDMMPEYIGDKSGIKSGSYGAYVERVKLVDMENRARQISTDVRVMKQGRSKIKITGGI